MSNLLRSSRSTNLHGFIRGIFLNPHHHESRSFVRLVSSQANKTNNPAYQNEKLTRKIIKSPASSSSLPKQPIVPNNLRTNVNRNIHNPAGGAGAGATSPGADGGAGAKGSLSQHPQSQTHEIPLSNLSQLHYPHEEFGDSDLSIAEQLERVYDEALSYCKSKKLPEDVDPYAVFACNRLNLRDINVLGFDYDYTLANYRPELEHLIYDLAREILLNKFKYPNDVEKLQYNPKFAVRGLHYDFHRGLLLKVDSFMQIQLGCVYRGLTPLDDEEVLSIYGSRKIPLKYIDEGPSLPSSQACMVQLSDLFSLPEMNLLCNVSEYLHQNNYDFTPESLFRDVKESVQSVHPIMHQIVSKDPSRYLEFDSNLRPYLTKLRENGKKLFLVTNSPFNFVDKGLNYILGSDWLDFFDVTVVSARKPYFFTNDSNPFRLYDFELDARLWDRVTKLEKGNVYYGGNIKQFQTMTGWNGENVLYFGDHPYSDLADVTLHHSWRTGAIIRELQHEIDTMNTPEFKSDMNWANFMTSLLETYQDLNDPDAQNIIVQWQSERKQIRKRNKEIFNPQFGSMFRTHLNPTFFSKRLFRFADIYTSNITNLLRYSVTHTFYPRRGALPHEYRSWFN